MLPTEDRSLNYSPGVVYRGPISSPSSVHLSISSHLILILPNLVGGGHAQFESAAEYIVAIMTYVT